ncbi:MAG: hypothetical protein P1V97_01660 [Planctomycetota bacterium]|nr:hypothetical protein [Planctomycetota bacterium]
MRLRSCPDCENQVSKRAKTCPSCGCPLQTDGVNPGLFALEVITGPLGCLPILSLALCASLPFLFSG